MTQIETQTLTIDTQEWFYRQATPRNETEQTPIVLLHGLLAHSYCWRVLLEDIAEAGLTAYAPDWLGEGASSKPSQREFSYQPSAFLTALEEFFAELNLSRFHLVIQGFVGSVGLQYAFRHPEQIERLVILNTPLSSSVRLPWLMRRWGFPLMGEMLTQDPLLVDRTLETGSGYVISDENLGIYRQPFLKNSKAGRSLVATIKNLNLSDAMTEIEAGWSNWEKPTQIIWGMDDPWLSSDIPAAIAQEHQNVNLAKLEEAKHYPQEHWSDEISPILLMFLRQQIV
ncbi:alpha/beta hydrolase fold protein [Halothece sp. PCC 7418]|uniref:alpha/beta fold hydrolase n=1 Tax=Halothece sp. (strain PCC 7418) TaxID=65093 RepID=UPI0002A06F2B|nr:alpha/beta fold hydrolase [Halothece sp. PCC 7418]AFZ44463.1 alpha/beta hydrolase fold protein [Halothece sp. PCC 7418]